MTGWTNRAEGSWKAPGRHGPNGIDGATGCRQGRIPGTGRDDGIRVDPDDLPRDCGSIHRLPDSGDLGPRVDERQEVFVQRDALDRLDEFVKLGQ